MPEPMLVVSIAGLLVAAVGLVYCRKKVRATEKAADVAESGSYEDTLHRLLEMHVQERARFGPIGDQGVGPASVWATAEETIRRLKPVHVTLGHESVTEHCASIRTEISSAIRSWLRELSVDR